MPDDAGSQFAHRCVILHYHFFKNAGTTVEWVLGKNFPLALSNLHASTDTGSIDHAELLAYLRAQPHLQAISSHHIRLPAPQQGGFEFLEWCLLRHPLDRLQSMYHYYRSGHPVLDENTLQARRLGIREFLQWMRDEQPFNVCNPQTTLCANGGRYVPRLTDGDRRRASDQIRRIALPGVVERFDDSLIVAEHRLREHFPDIDLSYVAKNVRPGRNPSLSERLGEFAQQCGSPLYAQLLRCNRIDLDLLADAEEELDRRLQAIPDLAQRRAEFHARCKCLRDRQAEEESSRDADGRTHPCQS